MDTSQDFTKLKYSELRVCGLLDLQEMTTQGWRLLSVLSDERMMRLTKGVAHYRDEPQYSHDPWVRTNVDEDVVTRDIIFLLMRNSDDPLTTVQQELAETQKKLGEVQNNLGDRLLECVKDIEAREKTIKGLKHDLELDRNHSKEALKAVDAQRDRTNKLEAALSKVREAIGSQRMKEILGAD